MSKDHRPLEAVPDYDHALRRRRQRLQHVARERREPAMTVCLKNGRDHCAARFERELVRQRKVALARRRECAKRVARPHVNSCPYDVVGGRRDAQRRGRREEPLSPPPPRPARVPRPRPKPTSSSNQEAYHHPTRRRWVVGQIVRVVTRASDVRVVYFLLELRECRGHHPNRPITGPTHQPPNTSHTIGIPNKKRSRA